MRANTPATRSDRRRDALSKLAGEHLVDPADANSSGEDLTAYLASPATIRRWAAVMHAPETGIVYLRPDFKDRDAAMAYAVELMGDLLYPEFPLAVVDLDTGKQFKAELVAKWTREAV
jgi:hypothetical protein